MTVGDTIISLDLLPADSGLLQKFVQQPATSRAGFSIHEPDILTCQILRFANPLRISYGDDEAFLPTRKCDHAEVLVRELLANVRQIELACLGIFEMRTGDVNLPFAKPAERQLARGGRLDNLYAADPFHHARQQTSGGVAPG